MDDCLAVLYDNDWFTKKIEYLDVLRDYYFPNKHFAPWNCIWHEVSSEETNVPVGLLSGLCCVD
jgi:hypothetical protein